MAEVAFARVNLDPAKGLDEVRGKKRVLASHGKGRGEFAPEDTID